MTKIPKGPYFLYKRSLQTNLVKAKASNVRVKFKNLVESAATIRDMSVDRALAFLKNVLAHKECVPFKKFKSGIGKCPQAKQFNARIGRWPINAVKCLQDLLRNACSNCEYIGKDPADYYICHIQVSQAPVISARKTYRAHGRINKYESHLSHIQIILHEKHSNIN